ncbi:unnamed protein product [Boreogadus saida]
MVKAEERQHTTEAAVVQRFGPHVAHRLTKGIPNYNINVDLGYTKRLHENEGKGLEVLACSSQLRPVRPTHTTE